MTERRTNKHSSAQTETAKVLNFTERHFTSNCYWVLVIKKSMKTFVLVLKFTSALSSPSSAAVLFLLLCLILATPLQPGQVRGCYLNDVLILVKQFCV